MRGDENRRMEAMLYMKDGRAEVVLSYRDNGERVGVHSFATLDEALDWMTAMKWDYKVAA